MKSFYSLLFIGLTILIFGFQNCNRNSNFNEASQTTQQQDNGNFAVNPGQACTQENQIQINSCKGPDNIDGNLVCQNGEWSCKWLKLSINNKTEGSIVTNGAYSVKIEASDSSVELSKTNLPVLSRWDGKCMLAGPSYSSDRMLSFLNAANLPLTIGENEWKNSPNLSEEIGDCTMLGTVFANFGLKAQITMKIQERPNVNVSAQFENSIIKKGGLIKLRYSSVGTPDSNPLKLRIERSGQESLNAQFDLVPNVTDQYYEFQVPSSMFDIGEYNLSISACRTERLMQAGNKIDTVCTKFPLGQINIVQ